MSITRADNGSEFRIVVGADYLHRGRLSSRLRGFRYRVLGFVPHYPSGQSQVSVQAISGPDEGVVFSCSEWHFANRYVPAPKPVAAAVPEKVAGRPEPDPPGQRSTP